MADHRDTSDRRYLWTLVAIVFVVCLILGTIKEMAG